MPDITYLWGELTIEEKAVLLCSGADFCTRSSVPCLGTGPITTSGWSYGRRVQLVAGDDSEW